MLSPFLRKLAACRKWIYITGAAWAVALLFVAHVTAHLRQQVRSVSYSSADRADDESSLELSTLEQENTRLEAELKKVPELTTVAGQLREKLSPDQTKDTAIWTAQSNALKTAIEQEKRELSEVYKWSTDWHMSKQREEARDRLAEKATALATDPDKEYAETKEALRQLAIAQKHLSEIRQEWTQLGKSEKDQFRPRLQQAQSEWLAADQKLGKDRVLYQALPLTNIQDPSTVVFLRSVVPDQNGTSITVYLDGNVQFSK